jgi:transposase
MRTIRATGQQQLFENRAPVGPRVTPLRNGFVEPDPESIPFGDGSLRQYLERVGMAWVFGLSDLLKSVNWTPFEARYPHRGRPPYAPRLVAGLILFGVRQGVDTSRGLERLARTDLACMWITGGIGPDHSAICDFMKRHEDLIRGQLFEDLTRQIMKRVGGDGRDVSVDGTVMQAVASRLRKLTLEAAERAAREAAEAAAASPQDTALEQKAALAQEVAAVAAERTAARVEKGKDANAVLVSPTEPDAVFQPTKEKLFRPSYKPSVAANAQQIVLAHEVHASSEVAVLEPLLDQVERVGGRPVERMKVDAGYHCDEVIELSLERNLDLLCPSGKVLPEGVARRCPPKYYRKNSFVYDEASDAYTCPAGKKLLPVSRARNGNHVIYATGACASCPLRSACTRGARGRRIKRYAGDAAKDALAEVMKQTRAREAFRRRAAEVEPVFAGIKRLRCRFRRQGLPGVRLEFALYVIAYNIGRAIALSRSAAEGAFARLILALVRTTLLLAANFKRWCCETARSHPPMWRVGLAW